MTTQPIDKIILNDFGVIIGYQIDSSNYTQKIDKPVWGKPDNKFADTITDYNNKINIRKNTTITPGLIYKNLCNKLGACLAYDPESAIIGQTGFDSTDSNQLWAFDGENLCNKSGFCINVSNNNDGTVLSQESKTNNPGQLWTIDSNGNICNKTSTKCIASAGNTFSLVDKGRIVQWSRTNENGQIWKFTDTNPLPSKPIINNIYWQNGNTSANYAGLTFTAEGRKPWNQYYRFSCVNTNGQESDKSKVFGKVEYGNYQMPKINVGANACGTDKLKIYRGPNADGSGMYELKPKNFDLTAAYDGKAGIFVDRTCTDYNYVGTTLNKNDTLNVCEGLKNTNGNFFRYQDDGNIGLFDKDNRNLWHASSSSASPSKLMFSADGKLVLKDINGVQFWSS